MFININKNINYYNQKMISKNANSGMAQGPTCKKIQNYIFKFSDLLGQGNFSKVYKAHHQITDEIVAIKIIELNSLKSKKLEQLLFSEIAVLKKLNHSNVLRCFEVFTSNRNCYIITELCNEGDLESKLRRRHHFTEDAAEPFIRDIFEGLMYLSEQNVIHRDLKVANVFIHNGKAKIADFGFAKFTNSKFKDINIGSPIYMSPQGFIENIYGPKTDIWAFGVLIYELLHGQTPFNFCKTQSQLKYNLSLPLNRNTIKSQISYQLQQVIMRCMQIDETKRVTTFQLGRMPYFQRILKKSSVPSNSKINSHFSATINQFHMRSPSYHSKQVYHSRQVQSTKTSSTLTHQNSAFQNKITSVDKNPRQNNFLTVNNNADSYDRGASPLNGFKNQGGRMNQTVKQDFFSTKNIDATNYLKPSENVQRKMKQRGITTDKRPVAIKNYTKSIQKRQGPHLISNTRLPKVISDRLTFKQTVNLLHYGRLIFKYVALLKQQQNWQHQELEEIQTFTKWLFIILDQVAQKIQSKGISFQGGTNSQVRQRKLIQVTSEYQKKYRKQLQAQLIQINLKGKLSQISLDYMKNFLYNQYLKYDKQVFRNQMTKNLLFLGHSVMMIYQATRILKKCYDQKNYYLLQNYKDVQLFLLKSKDAMDLDSYRQKRKSMSIYA